MYFIPTRRVYVGLAVCSNEFPIKEKWQASRSRTTVAMGRGKSHDRARLHVTESRPHLRECSCSFEPAQAAPSSHSLFVVRGSVGAHED